MYPCGANISVPLTQMWTVSATTVTHAHLLLFLRGLQTDGHSSGARTRCRGTLANSCLWLVLTVSDRSKRVKKERKSVFCISECVCVHLCHRKCKEPPRDLFSSLTRVGLSSHNPLELLLNRKVKNDAYRSFSFSLCRHTEATLLSAVFTPALFVCVWN